jgi:hypothetical protein
MNKQTQFVVDKISDERIKTVLNIGYRYCSDHTILNFCNDNDKKFIVLEAHKPNCDDILNKKLCSLYNMDVRNISKLNIKVDLVIWLHGPEHIYWSEFLECKDTIESKSNYGVIYQAPIGDYPQGEIYQNKYEKHVQALTQDMFSDIGYDVENYKEFGEATFSAYKIS